MFLYIRKQKHKLTFTNYNNVVDNEKRCFPFCEQKKSLKKINKFSEIIEGRMSVPKIEYFSYA